MTSPRKLIANRENARRSTGPRTLASKARAAQKSMRHGLSVSLVRAAELSAEIYRLGVALSVSLRVPAALELHGVRAYRTFVLDEQTAQMAPLGCPPAADEKRVSARSAKTNHGETA